MKRTLQCGSANVIKKAKIGTVEESVNESPYFAQKTRLSDEFFEQDCAELARNLLGKELCRVDCGQLLKGKVVETEAYVGVEDEASHTYRGKRTERNEAMFMKPGTAYVYINRGIYNCFNVTSAGYASAVLVRAIEPLEGLEVMRRRRLQFRKSKKDKFEVDTLLCNGPAKLCIAMNIDKSTINKVDLTNSSAIWFEEGESVPYCSIVSTPRVGINVSKTWKNKPLRFFIKGSEYISHRSH